MRAYRRSPHTAWRQIEGETVVLDLRGRRACALDPAGGAVWQAIEQARPVAEEGIIAFLDQLAALGLVEITAAEPGGDPLELAADARPQVLWQEQVRLFASSCSFEPGNCDSSPQSNAPTGMTAPESGLGAGPGEVTPPWFDGNGAGAAPLPFATDPWGRPDDPSGH